MVEAQDGEDVVDRRDLADRRDLDDPLAGFRDRFQRPEGVIYLDGNSLGPPPKEAAVRAAQVINEEWGDGLIRSWNDAGWMSLPERVGDKIARLIGAPPAAVIACDGTSINLFKLLAAALALRPGRSVILSDSGNFPTDLYMAQGLSELLDQGHELRLVEPDAVAGALDASVAVLMLTEVDYRSGRRHDMAGLTEQAHQVGALALWDLAHSAGAFPVDLASAKVDLAVGCGYKYLNGGPGAPAFLYVAPDLQAAVKPPLSGWLGHDSPFAFDLDYRPADGIRRNMCGTPSVIAMSLLEVGLDVILEAGMAAIKEKSRALTALFIETVEAGNSWGFELLTPRDPAARGSQVSFSHPQGYAIMRALIDRGVIGDFRAPDVLRFGFAPLYLSFAEVRQAALSLHQVMESDAWRDTAYQTRQFVT